MFQLLSYKVDVGKFKIIRDCVINKEVKNSAGQLYLVDGFASNTGTGVQVLVSHGVGVGISNPGHLSLTSAHVRGRYINGGSKETLLGKLKGKTSGDTLKLVLGVGLGVNLDTSLNTKFMNIKVVIKNNYFS
jgi:hypothetical protein